MDDGHLAEVALTLAILGHQDVALALLAAKHFARGSDFESLRVSFPRFGDAGVFGHRGGDCSGIVLIGKDFFILYAGRGQKGRKGLKGWYKTPLFTP
jgi:hypothetical protein